MLLDLIFRRVGGRAVTVHVQGNVDMHKKDDILGILAWSPLWEKVKVWPHKSLSGRPLKRYKHDEVAKSGESYTLVADLYGMGTVGLRIADMHGVLVFEGVVKVTFLPLPGKKKTPIGGSSNTPLTNNYSQVRLL